jgi:hypothetical protein
MKRRRREYPIGSISHATMRPEDLIPTFLVELEGLAKQRRNRDHLCLCLDIQARMDLGEDKYFKSDDRDFDLEALFDALDEYAGPYFYFGANEGDGSDYGFWLSENWTEDTDAMKVDDLCKVPKDFAGEIFVTNDHGNLSYYLKARTQPPREIWAIV